MARPVVEKMVVNTNFGQWRRHVPGSILQFKREGGREREREEGAMALSILSSASDILRKLLHGGPSSALAERSDSQLTSSSRSHAPMLTHQNIHSLADTIHSPSATGGEIVTRPPVSNIEPRTPATVFDIESGGVALPAAGSDQEDKYKFTEKVAKILGTITLTVSVGIVSAVATNMKKSATNQGELIFYKASAGIALGAFLTSLGLLVFAMKKMAEHAEMKMWMQRVLMFLTLLFLAGSVVAIFANTVV